MEFARANAVEEKVYGVGLGCQRISRLVGGRGCCQSWEVITKM
jgi:hypothetical protein